MQNIIHPLLTLSGIKAFYTTRGIDYATPYSGFNVCHYTGDTPGHYSKCRKELAAELGVEEDAIVMPRQTHSSRVATVTEKDTLLDDGIDALVTTSRRIIIGVNTADCVPVVMADPVAGVIGVAHAGWRGALSGIVANTFDAMVGAGASHCDIQVAFGPSICSECFEVGEEVASLFPQEDVVRRYGFQRPHIDLQRFLARQLAEYGIASSAITPFDRRLCTRCHPTHFFSARALGIRSGRVFTFAYLE